METMRVEVISRETIKPSSPTPHHLRTFKLSFLDQCAELSHSWVVFFYSAAAAAKREDKSLAVIIFKESLSKVLTHFYPLAGRIKADNMSVDCNDQGAEFIEARVNCTLSHLLLQRQQNIYKILRKFAPQSAAAAVNATTSTPPLIIQTSVFDCGGVAMFVSMSHKLTDGATLGSFVNAWASFAVSGGTILTPTLQPQLAVASSLFPPLTDPHPLQLLLGGSRNNTSHHSDGIATRYVFSSSSITALKAKAASKSVPSPSRVEAVMALICKCWTTAKLQMMMTRGKRRSVFVWVRNIRPITVPPLSGRSFGNLLTFVVGHGMEYETTQDMGAFVQSSRSSMTDRRPLSWINNIQEGGGGGGATAAAAKRFQQFLGLWARDDLDLYFVDSMCKIPLYEADFGWGKPNWLTLVPTICTPNQMFLLDTADGGGIEARLNFAQEEEVALFESNQELLHHASFHPLMSCSKL